MKTEQKKDKGVAGLTILLSMIVMLFVIGLLVMIFAIMSGKMQDTDTIYMRTGSATVGLESISLTDAGTNVAKASLRSPLCSLVAVYNGTALIGNSNVTEISECKFANTTSQWTTYKLNYTYTYLADGSGAVATINDTSNAINSVTDWFDIFIVIGAMIVLILLTVVIITAIRSSGMVGGNEQSGANQVGTA